jgi:hypothetical protein
LGGLALRIGHCGEIAWGFSIKRWLFRDLGDNVKMALYDLGEVSGDH